MNFKRYHVSKNLYNTAETDWTVGILDDNGQPTGSTSSHYTTNFTEVSPQSIYCLSGTIITTGTFRVYFYDGEKNWISRTAQKYSGDFTTPSNCYYIRIQVTANISSTADWMLNTGSEALPYEPYGDTWHDIPHYIHNTSTDTIITLPADIYANDNNATIGLKGNMVQTGTPSPSSPIYPQETGDKTANLFDKNWLVEGYTLDFNTGLPSANELRIATTSPVDVSDVTQITVSYTVSGWQRDILFIYSIFKNGSLVERLAGNNSGDTVDIGDADELYLCFYDSLLVPESKITPDNLTNLMVNSGTTALPFEPYGQYKIPISSANTTTPVYLGEVETTRKIKKLVLDGTESLINAGGNAPYRLPINDIAISSSTSSIEWYCSHYQSLSTEDSWASYDYCISRTSTTAQSLQFRDVTKGNITAFKQYLAQQYAAGTPVTIWYVLATEETAVVNEPLMRIGDYADTLSNVSIPVTAGGDTLSVGTTVQPSEVTVNYKGWHPVADVHERDDGVWT